MSLDIDHKSTFNSTNSSDTYDPWCKDMYEGVVFWACFSLVCVLCGFPACLAVLWELLQKYRRGVSLTPNDVFMLNLTVMDLVFLGFNPLSVFNYVFWYILMIEKVSMFIYAFTMFGRPLFMTCICLDCYLAVVHPLTYRARNGLTPRVLMSIGVWVITLVYGALIVINAPIPDAIMISLLVLPYVLTILTIGICDFFILRALKSSDPGGRDLHPQKKKALQIIINSLVMTVLSYLPPMLMYMLIPLIPENVFTCRVVYITYCPAIAGSAVMPLLHLSNLKEKRDFITLGCCNSV